MTEMIRTEGLIKSYGKTRGLAGLDLEVRPGEVYGFLGPNGAGKTTTIRILLDLIRPTSGRASSDGRQPPVSPWRPMFVSAPTNQNLSLRTAIESG